MIILTLTGCEDLVESAIHHYRIAEVQKTTDQAALMKIATNSRDDDACEVALRKITDQHWLAVYATNSANPSFLRCEAAWRLNDQDLIFDMLKAGRMLNPQSNKIKEFEPVLFERLTNKVMRTRLAMIGAEPPPSLQSGLDTESAGSSAHLLTSDAYPATPSQKTEYCELIIDEIQKVSLKDTLAFVLNSPVEHEIVTINLFGQMAGLPDGLTDAEREKALKATMAGKVVMIIDPVNFDEVVDDLGNRLLYNLKELGFNEMTGRGWWLKYKELKTEDSRSLRIKLQEFLGSSQIRALESPIERKKPETPQERLEHFNLSCKSLSRKAWLQALASLTDRELLAELSDANEIARLRFFLTEPIIQSRLGITKIVVDWEQLSKNYSPSYYGDEKPVTKYGETITFTIGGGYPSNQLSESWSTFFPSEISTSYDDYDVHWKPSFFPATMDLSRLTEQLLSHFTEIECLRIALEAGIQKKYIGITVLARLTDRTLLTQVVKEARNSDVRKAARQRLEKLGDTP
jgi:hypothetical protein